MSNSHPRAGGPALQLGKYRLIIELAQGGMGFVYLAVAQGPAGFNKLTVIKELKPSLLEEPGFLEMFLDEARLSARLSHPNVVQTNEVAVEQGRAYLAMEYLDGQSLNRVRSRLGKARTLPLAADVRIVAQACAGLHYAHELRDFDGTPLGVVHRDVSPHNIFVTYDGQVKIVDFGVAKALSSNHESTVGVLKGKVPYMAPEQVMGGALDRRADLFALGVILWEAAAGRRLWEGLRSETIIARMMTGDLPRLAAVAPGCDPHLIAVIERAMAWSKDERYPTADALRWDLERWLSTVRDGDHRAVAAVGDEMTRAFATERAHVASAVAAQIRLLGAATGAAPGIELVRLPFAGTGSYASMSGGSAAAHLGMSGSNIVGLPPAQAGGAAVISGSHSGLAPSLAEHVVEQHSSNGTASMAVATSRQPPPPAPAPSRAGVVAAIAFSVIVLATAAGALLVFVARSKSTTSAVVADSSVASAAPASAGDATVVPGAAESARAASSSAGSDPAGTIELTVRVTPPNARVFVDGAALPKNAQAASFKKDGVTHRIRAEAPGFVTKTELVTFEHDAEVVLQLEHAGGGSAPRPKPQSGTPAQPDTPPKPDAPPKPGKPQRPIDTDLDPR